MIAKFLEPSADRLICAMFGDIVNEQSTNSTAVVAIIIGWLDSVLGARRNVNKFGV
jgi:hypothetical protein